MLVIYQKNERSKPKPVVLTPWANNYDSVVTLDLNEFGKKNLLRMVCACKTFIKG